MTDAEGPVRGIDSEVAVRARLTIALTVSGMNRTQLAERAGVPYRTLQNWLHGTHAMPASAVSPLARALGVSCDWLLTGTPAELEPASMRRALAFAWASNPVREPSEEDLDRLARSCYAFYLVEYCKRFEGPLLRLDEDARVSLGDTGVPVKSLLALIRRA